MFATLKPLLVPVLALGFFAGAFKGCSHTPPTPPPSDVASAPALGNAQDKKESKAAAAVEGARKANQSNPDGPAKQAVEGELSVASSNLPNPSPEDTKESDSRVALALAGKLADAEAKWAAAREDGFALQKRVGELEEQVRTERAKAAAELQAQLKEARDEARREADAKLNFWLQLGLFGGGALSIVAAVVCIQLAATVPLIGPNIIRALFISGGILVTLGLLIRSVDRFVDQHPQLFFGGLIAVILAVVAAVALAYANHQHHKSAQAAG